MLIILDYPLPPLNISVDTTVIIGNVKFLESTVSWDFEPGKFSNFNSKF